MREDQIALQLYTVRRLIALDLPGTLDAVAAAGYQAVELAGLPTMEPADIARMLSASGLRPIAAHESIESLREDPAMVADRLATLGCPRAIVPAIPEAERRRVDDVRAFAAELGGFARILADRGIRLGYHNHAFEFAPLDGTTIWDVLLSDLPPDVVLELDVYWAAVAGRDPATLIEAQPSRIDLLHIKDVEAGPEVRDATPGEGVLGWPPILDAARAASVAWYIVEQDEPRAPLLDIARARRFLSGLSLGGSAPG